LQVGKRFLTHSAAVAIRIAAGADDKVLRHQTTVEANGERSTPILPAMFRLAMQAGVQHQI